MRKLLTFFSLLLTLVFAITFASAVANTGELTLDSAFCDHDGADSASTGDCTSDVDINDSTFHNLDHLEFVNVTWDSSTVGIASGAVVTDVTVWILGRRSDPNVAEARIEEPDGTVLTAKQSWTGTSWQLKSFSNSSLTSYVEANAGSDIDLRVGVYDSGPDLDNLDIDYVRIEIEYDDAAPAVSGITWDPMYPTCTEDVKVCADITDDSAITEVDLLWDTGSDSGTFAMSHDSGDTYCRTLSAATLEALDALDVDFDIYVEDEHGFNDTVTGGTFTFDCRAPNADADGPYSCDEGDSASLDASASNDTVDSSLDFAWDLDDDGDYDDATGDSPSFTCVDDGSYTVRVNVSDDAGNWSTASSTVTVSNVDPIASANGPYSGDEGSSVALSASETDVGVLDTHTFAWDLDDDGTYETAGQNVSFSCIDDSVNTVHVNVTDDDGGWDTDTTTVTCYNVDPVVDAGSNQTIDEGDNVTISPTWTDVGTNDTHTVSVDWDDGTINSLYTHLYCDGDNTYDVVVEVTDDDGGMGSDTLTVTVNNVAPTFDNLPNSSIGVEGESFDYDVDASDVGCDTLTYSLASGDPAGMTIDSSTGEISWPSAVAGDYEVMVGVYDGDDTTYANLTIHIYDYKIDFDSGLNCFSIPLVPDYDNTSINYVLGDDVSMVADKIWSYTYDEGLDKNVWKYNEPLVDGTRWTAFSTRVQEIVPGYGYYLFMNDSVVSYQDGKRMYGGFSLLPPFRPSVKLNHGDNLIGHYYMLDVPHFAEINDLTGNDLVRSLAFQGLYDEEGEIADTLYPTECYWASIHGEDVVEYWPSDADSVIP